MRCRFKDGIGQMLSAADAGNRKGPNTINYFILEIINKDSYVSIIPYYKISSHNCL